MKGMIRELDSVTCMANLRGDHIKVPEPQPFSFYFSADMHQHEIRVKPSFNPAKLSPSNVGTLKLCDDWEFIPGKDDKHISAKQISEMKAFFRTYLVLFCAAWDGNIQEDDVQDYFRELITFDELLECFSFYSHDMDDITSISDLEKYCVDNNLVDLRDNI